MCKKIEAVLRGLQVGEEVKFFRSEVTLRVVNLGLDEFSWTHGGMWYTETCKQLAKRMTSEVAEFGEWKLLDKPKPVTLIKMNAQNHKPTGKRLGRLVEPSGYLSPVTPPPTPGYLTEAKTTSHSRTPEEFEEDVREFKSRHPLGDY